MPWWCGLYMGTLFGPFPGAIGALDPESPFSATAGALGGLVLGTIVVAIVIAIALAWQMEPEEELSFFDRLVFRYRFVGSLFLILPFAWHCLRAGIRDIWSHPKAVGE